MDTKTGRANVLPVFYVVCSLFYLVETLAEHSVTEGL